jgi:hypothetical protein
LIIDEQVVTAVVPQTQAVLKSKASQEIMLKNGYLTLLVPPIVQQRKDLIATGKNRIDMIPVTAYVLKDILVKSVAFKTLEHKSVILGIGKIDTTIGVSDLVNIANSSHKWHRASQFIGVVALMVYHQLGIVLL